MEKGAEPSGEMMGDERWKIARCCGAKHVKAHKTHQHRSTVGRWHVQKVHAVLPRSTFPSQKWKTDGYAALFDVQMSFCVAGARDCAPCQKWAKCEGFVAVSKALAGVGHLKRICKHASRVAGAIQETCSSEMLGGPGADFLRGCILEHQIFRFAEMISRDRHSTSYDLASLFRGRRNSLDRWTGKIAKRIGRGRQLSIFVFDVVKWKHWGNLAELLRFWRSQFRKLSRSRRIASLQIDR